MITDLLQALFLFGLVLTLVWVTTRLVGMRMTAPSRGRLLRVLEHLPAGKDRSVMLVEIGGQVYLLGVTVDRINLLDRIGDGAAAQDVLRRADAISQERVVLPMPASFQGLFEKAREAIAPRLAAAVQATARVAAAHSRGASKLVATGDEIPVGVEEVRLRQRIERLRRLAGPRGGSDG